MDTTPTLRRELHLLEATALNMIDMVGIGPFVVLPLVVNFMGGPQAIVAWIAGAMLSIFDGLVWAELGAKMPSAGGSYVFLRELFGQKKLGSLMSFLFIWQTSIQAPLVVASGAIGFAQYFSYLLPLSELEKKIISGLVVLILVILLYRRIGTIGKISVLLWVGVLGTIIWIIFAGATHFNASLAFAYPEGAFDLTPMFFFALGQASIKTVYCYLGYYNVCHLGSEIREPESAIPKSIIVSIIGIAILYLAMQLSVLGVLPWKEIAGSEFVFSLFMEQIYGHTAATIATLLVLWIAFSSLYAVLLGYSRIPYAAAVDGVFFKSFAKLHPTKNFPYVSLLFIGALAFIFSLLFKLTQVITAILAMRILVQFIGQSVGVILHHRNREALPYRMPWFPLPAVLAVLAWTAIFISTGVEFMIGGIVAIGSGILVFLFRARTIRAWPFSVIALLSFTVLMPLNAQSPPKVLVVTAHPDDETACAATIYAITRSLHGTVDLALITNGEAGYRYSLLAEPMYGLPLTEEKVARAKLPDIRKRELKAGGKILGIRNYYFFDQRDNHYTLDADTVLSMVWDTARVKQKLIQIIDTGTYDLIFTLLPLLETHGHHKGASLLALESYARVQPPHTAILGITVDDDTSAKHPLTLFKHTLVKIDTLQPPLFFDRSRPFGFRERLDYRMIVNWVIAEHKSQGALQGGMNLGRREVYYLYEINPPSLHHQVIRLFDDLNRRGYPK